MSNNKTFHSFEEANAALEECINRTRNLADQAAAYTNSQEVRENKKVMANAQTEPKQQRRSYSETNSRTFKKQPSFIREMREELDKAKDRTIAFSDKLMQQMVELAAYKDRCAQLEAELRKETSSERPTQASWEELLAKCARLETLVDNKDKEIEDLRKESLEKDLEGSNKGNELIASLEAKINEEVTIQQKLAEKLSALTYSMEQRLSAESEKDCEPSIAEKAVAGLCNGISWTGRKAVGGVKAASRSLGKMFNRLGGVPQDQNATI